ncbi:cobalt-zinc-cadmium resistance protein CzcA [Arcticibacter tournemirensis]|uniref:CusA/CzcA family heavy metal efflux RND transporter n=1 Tax=Arcticibacter tournemirensis TaxID=699437 RepID=A0A5M9GXU1_9SPHI|nr:CusA/CzcA family heavy metal efflux RND transporter [Arcticibacter tournemirensis]KAA8478257.1 CusA/CzcA family heavy metal efflux RND transporter [Arcticibacter tournemirensis]TQM50715.1 cobalt-zinc-cadmium resistance protein CzcA [Arcticibacter tournemirensis]
MLDKIIYFSIKNKLVIGLFTLALICWGVYSVTKLPIDATPDITDNQVMVITVSPTLAAQEIEQLVTFPVEQTMVSIPGIKDMRSFSRFGLSIVTIVFEEKVDIYWGRQQVQERLSIAAKNIPQGVGTPEMAPLTTGLGEIFQYVVHAKKGYEDKYNATELRTIQDWIIKRQLLGTPGVAEVSGFGGFVKQYEIAIDPDKIGSLGVTITDIFNALNRNNQNTGGAYIDKGPNAYFIRSEGLVKNIEEINRIVVKTNNGMPVLIRDLAKVQFGNGVRYGAATRNGQGETVTGIVMMLKGANSSEVISDVKERITQIQKTLPEGVVIEPFLDRKKLVDNAISTVTTNLIEGALIVIFVLILFLGNLRGGLVVASVIPLAMLFAISMMNLFGVSGNLMSLGAIDFGIIVDGTVIIVEAVMHRIKGGGGKYPGISVLSRAQMDEEVYESSRKIRSAAAFGEIIILIVYLPLLTLVGVEGKMFMPMAQTVSFAILGAFLLSFTYVPMMSALALSRNTTHKHNFSDRMMEAIQRAYTPIIEGAMRRKLLVAVIAVSLFTVTLFAFTRMGAEFIPQLDEGDFAVETRVPVGSSINQMIDVSQKAQTILLKNYPEVKQVVNKIGSGEIPTDPMPIEAGDMVVTLKPKKEWRSAENREELIEKMQASLSVIPNATFSFQQPIQMRFNELLTGAKQDVVLKIYGEDLDVLSDLAREIGRKIRPVDGVEDLYIEQITGLPQIGIQFNRDKIALYGLNIEDVNAAIEAAFAGKMAGLVYEGERRFDMVVRLDRANRRDITDVRNLYIGTPTGQQIPLSEVAEISYKPGPVQIQRDNAKRRITIGFNVRNRDVKSIVTDIQNVIARRVNMPAGYYVTYGGQFKNLEEANARLAVALPAALLLILLLLYFTFRSVKQGLLIFTAIPLSAIGGVFALLIRDMPFSISAGVGFIALFGVAVLNGIVLIAEFNRLEAEGVSDIYERIRLGTKVRLRPVLMTATVASFGFLPMALSGSSGAEVQRPLATVVIGGLITATILTLVVLPVLYIYFSKSKGKLNKQPATLLTIFIALGFTLPFNSKAQSAATPANRVLTLEQAISEALQNNNEIRIAAYQISEQQALKPGSISLPKTELSYTQGVVSNPTISDNIISASQRIDFPTLYVSQGRLANERVASRVKYKAVKENELRENVRRAYLQYQYVLGKRELLMQLDSIYANLSKASGIRYRTGESTSLENMTSTVQSRQIKNELEKNGADLTIAAEQLRTLLNTTDNITVADKDLVPGTLVLPLEDTSSVSRNPTIAYLKQELNVSKQMTSVERNRMLPEIILGYNGQTYKGVQMINGDERRYTGSDRFNFYQVGLAIPIFPGGYRSKIRSLKVSEQIARSQVELATVNLNGHLKQMIQEYQKLKKSVEYYRSEALPQADLIIGNAEKAFRSGDISYTQYLQNLTISTDIHTQYLDNLFNYNQAIISIESVLGSIQ